MTSTTNSSAPADSVDPPDNVGLSDSADLPAVESDGNKPTTGAAVSGGERDELIRQLAEMQQAFERRALSAMAEPLISTPLTMQQLKVLAMIAIDPARATGQNLAGLLRVSVASMSGMIDRLVDHGMIRRTEDPMDRRVRRLTVTTEGSEMIRSLLSSAGTLPTPVLHRMAMDDLRALVRGIRAADVAAQQVLASGPDPA